MLDLIERDRCFVIAEAGTNHAVTEEDVARREKTTPFQEAIEYVYAAQRVGADAIKFQIFNRPIKDDFFCWIDGDEKRSTRWWNSYVSLNDWKEVKGVADGLGIMLLASVFQHSTVQWLNELEVEATKVASRAARDFPYGCGPKPYLISDGMYADIFQRHTGLDFDLHDKLTLAGMDYIRLQCEANYPSTTWYEGEHAGFSDHSGTPWRAIDAIRGGAYVVEVHFYINKEDAGPDLLASLNLDQLKLVCQARDAFAEMQLGYYDTPKAASAAYCRADTEMRNE